MFYFVNMHLSHLLIVCAEKTPFFDTTFFAIFACEKFGTRSCAKKVAQKFCFFCVKKVWITML